MSNCRPLLLSSRVNIHVSKLKKATLGYHNTANSSLKTFAENGDTSQGRLLNPHIVIKTHVSNERWDDALKIFHHSLELGIDLHIHTIPLVIKSCARLKDLTTGKRLHSYVIIRGMYWDAFLQNSFLSMYAKCGRLKDARQVFDEMSDAETISWNSMISGYLHNGECDNAMELFIKMGSSADSVTWSSMVSGYAQKGHCHEGIDFFIQMRENGAKPLSTSFTGILSCCSQLELLDMGMQVHGHLVKFGFECDFYVVGALLDMYARCSQIFVARKLFDDMREKSVVSWTTMISGYVQNGFYKEGLEIFGKMRLGGVKPNCMTLSSVLPCYAQLGDLQQAMNLHGFIIKHGFIDEVFVGSAMINVYSKCDAINMASQVFNEMPIKNVVSWNAMIAGYGLHNLSSEALKLVKSMHLYRIEPTSITLATILPHCSELALSLQGKEIHGQILKKGCHSLHYVGNALIDMYSKCGNIGLAKRLFDSMPLKDKVSWTCMIACYGMHGLGHDALDLFKKMQGSGLKPDTITFVAVLSACSHSGLVDEGLEIFNSMVREFRVEPIEENYACMVDLLGRAGRLDEARGVIDNMPFQPSHAIWGSLLGACRIHNNVQVAEYAAHKLFKEIQVCDHGYYALISNLYAKAGKWDDVARIRSLMKSRKVTKRPGCSWIEVNNKVRTFYSDDQSCPQSHKIYEMLKSLMVKMKDAGYIPDTSSVLTHS